MAGFPIRHRANTDDIARQDSAARALGRLARTFPAQIETLNRYRSHGEPAITVRNAQSVQPDFGATTFPSNDTR